MNNMFCFQCEQAAGGIGCTVKGVCGKPADVANRQDELTGALIGLSRAVLKSAPTDLSDELVVDGLFTCITNVSFDEKRVALLADTVRDVKNSLGGAPDFDAADLWQGDVNVVSLRSTLLFGLRGMAAYAHHAATLGKRDRAVTDWFYKGLSALAEEHSIDQWLALLMEFGQINLQCMALLDSANTGAYGSPAPASVTTDIEKGPFIVITGHDLHDLKMLLEQTEGKGVNIYTHSEMLPAHGYPELRKHAHLKGNFGTAWQNQQKEFDHLPAPILFTTNCLMPPKANYGDRVFTTSVVAYPAMQHVPQNRDGSKDFTALINKAIELGGFAQDTPMSGINGGHTLQTGFARDTVMAAAGTVIDAVKTGALKHIFLVGGCDGAKPGRNYYTEFVRQTPADTLVLTLACGKYRFNDMDLGTLGGLPRLLDMGQCNDAYSAIKVAAALAEAFNCGLNDLPLTLVLSWYEQKAVCILLTLLSLGMKNIYIGPTLPAFFSADVVDTLVKLFNLIPIGDAKQDLDNILNKN